VFLSYCCIVILVNDTTFFVVCGLTLCLLTHTHTHAHAHACAHHTRAHTHIHRGHGNIIRCSGSWFLKKGIPHLCGGDFAFSISGVNNIESGTKDISVDV